MPKFSQQHTLMQPTKNCHLFFLYGDNYIVFLRLGLTFLCLVGLLSCSNFMRSNLNTIGVNITPIEKLKLQKDNNATVYIQGKVEKQVPLLQRRLYQLNDSTGKIWVLTDKTNVQESDQLMIEAKVRYSRIPLAGKEFGEVYVEEQQQLERKPSK